MNQPKPKIGAEGKKRSHAKRSGAAKRSVLPGEYEVEKILGKKTEPTLLYKVKWAGYPVSEATWEPLANLDNVQDMVEEFDQICEEKLLALCAKDIGGQGIGQEPGSTHEEEKSMKGFKKTYNIGQHLEISGPKYLAMPLPEQHATKKVLTASVITSREASQQKKKKKFEDTVHRSPGPVINGARSDIAKSKLNSEHVDQGNVNTGQDILNSSGRSLDSTQIPRPKGTFETDVPLTLQFLRKIDGALRFQVKWKPREDGTTPEKTYYTNAELRKLAPDILFDYYEKHMNIIKSSADSSYHNN